MKVKVTILSIEEILEKYPVDNTTIEAIYSRAAAKTDGIDIACVEGLKDSETIIEDMQQALDNHVGESCRAEIYCITDMSELKESDKIYCAFETKEGGSY